jgi:hypothetical protein
LIFLNILREKCKLWSSSLCKGTHSKIYLYKLLYIFVLLYCVVYVLLCSVYFLLYYVHILCLRFIVLCCTTV